MLRKNVDQASEKRQPNVGKKHQPIVQTEGHLDFDKSAKYIDQAEKTWKHLCFYNSSGKRSTNFLVKVRPNSYAKSIVLLVNCRPIIWSIPKQESYYMLYIWRIGHLRISSHRVRTNICCANSLAILPCEPWPSHRIPKAVQKYYRTKLPHKANNVPPKATAKKKHYPSKAPEQSSICIWLSICIWSEHSSICIWLSICIVYTVSVSVSVSVFVSVSVSVSVIIWDHLG